MRRKLIAGNWKMNGSLAANEVLLGDMVAGLGKIDCSLAVCVPAPYLEQCRYALNSSSVAWGGQDLSVHDSGAYTGEVSGAMLRDFGCSYVIVGHSERRSYHGESNEVVAQKAARALSFGLIPIVCIGESLAQRESGKTDAAVCKQIDPLLALLDADSVGKIVVAYEPVWAIGTGKTATPQMAQEVHATLRSRLAVKSGAVAEKVQILYGGSMKPENAEELLAMPDIDGGLIGGASLKAADFLAIAQFA